MKIAITSEGSNLESRVDPRFGRAAFIIVVDTDTLEFEAFDNNENVNAFKGAGIKAASLICDKGAEVLLTGFCGPNAFKTLDAAGIKVVNDAHGTILETLKEFKKGNLEFAEEANVEGHW